MLQSDKPIPPLDHSASRQLWVSWGLALISLGIGYLIGGTFFPILSIAYGMIAVLRGHFPGLFAREIEAQIIAGTPYRRVESLTRWVISLTAALLVSLVVSHVLKKAAPENADISKLINDAVRAAVQPKSVSGPESPTVQARQLPVTPTSPTSEPEVVITAPKDVYYFTWVPIIDRTPRIRLYGKEQNPWLEIRKLANDPIVAVTLKWSIEGPSTKSIFLSNPHFAKLQPTIIDGWFEFGPALLVEDRTQTTIEYIGNDPIKLPIPPTFWNGFEVRLIAGQERPPETSATEFGSRRDTIPLGDVSLTYRQGRKSYRRRFRIDVSVVADCDGAMCTGYVPYEVPLEKRSPDDLRAALQFSSVQY